ncbi:hypothetical protein GQ602_007315 [Ophiocordyceps camponoti-floridani]|uniref:Uncharacterized protein n=1 Tax=Ophiocordyceps camponoti-floridani TaxID=2030778 RepID=A0A8H4VAR2_9HYPO|nr:hypothetical protein GQ602_007315 [Ophiocordyceps camponoti-floridani]
MANGLDRLERLFAYKRKTSTERIRQSATVQPPPPEPQFPSASFIRPRASRMAARDEVRRHNGDARSPSIPDIITALRTTSTHAQVPDSAFSGFRPLDLPKRSASNRSKQAESFVSGLSEYRFTDSVTRPDDGPSVSAPVDTPTTHVAQPPSPRCFSPCHIVRPPARLATPPSFEAEDSGLALSDLSAKMVPPGAQTRVPPTPEDTPDFGPVEDTYMAESRPLDSIAQAISKSSLLDAVASFDQLSLDRSYSQSSITPSERRSFCSSILREPDVHEFLTLSDDDIAESAPPSPTLSTIPDTVSELKRLPPMSLSISPPRPPVSSLLTLTPPRTSRPAAIAAFEAARMARRYDFDLVYVVNLWPDTQLVAPRPGHPAAVQQRPMMGRLLAAHGLHHVPSPLQISSSVHTTILRADGWIEYRNERAMTHDLARGFACAFYTGQYTRNESESPVSGVRLSGQIDRGIVFAAYRKPRMGIDRLGRSFSEEDLGEMHREAEALVEMLIDIHVASRQRQPMQRSPVDETGPMPLQQEHQEQQQRS